MATEALRSQVAAKWQDAFARLNRDEPGILGLMSFSQAWTMSTEFLRPKDLAAPRKAYNLELVRHAFDVVAQSRRLPVMLEAFLEDLRRHFYLIERDIQDHILEYEQSGNPIIVNNLVHRLKEWYDLWIPIPELGSTIRSAYTLNFQTHLFSILPPSFIGAFKNFVGATLPPLDAAGEQPIALSDDKWNTFEILGLLDRYETVIYSVGYEHIERHVLNICTRKWDTPMLSSLRTWLTGSIMPWIFTMYAKDVANKDDAMIQMTAIASRFDFHMTKTLCSLRISELFDIIVDFPDSTHALEDLKECLPKVDQRSHLVHSLRKANRRRLLHPGADTKLILQQYVATIKCLRIVDPPGVLLFKVADPIRRYLRERPDTIRCIVANLVGDEDSGDSIVDDNEPPQPLHQVEIEDYTDVNWEPEPVDAGPDFRANKPSDVISTLVSIYDSKDLFVKELQVLLAQRLLSITDGNMERVERERRNIEILKIRFGDAALQVCEVMLKDMTDSKRIDVHIQSQKPSIVHPTIISRHFWPTMDTNDLKMPGQFQSLQELYAKEFATFKPDKRLRWLPHLGTVQVELTLKDRTLEVEVPPLEAAFVELFSEKDTWSISELTERVGRISKSAALKALLTWVDHGVLKETSENTFVLLEVTELVTGQRVHERLPMEEEDSAAASAQRQQSQQMQVYWKFIQGMLTNLPNMPVERIHAMLGFIDDYNLTVEQLGGLMEAARREKLVDVKDGLWRLIPQT